ncbi:MAG: hypothetical protein GWN29_03870 [Gammaproteobacteria bacterium]|nr:hypothetical protein [Gammaproteobacteria bacterium]
MAGSGKQRFLCKRTANAQRIRLLNRMFPEAMFLHLIRDGRAVAHSLTRVPWWDDVDVWWLGQRPPQWRAAGRSDLELTALHWRRDTQEALDAAGVLGSRYHEIRYEDLTRDTHAVLRTICEFAGFSFPSDYSALVPSTLPDMNHKWRQTLSHAELDIIFEAAGELLEALGYSRE